MHRVKRFALFLAAILLFAIVVVFALENLQPVHLTFMGWQSPDWPLVLLVSLAFVAGGLIGMALSIPARARSRFHLSGLRSEVSRFRKENEALRGSSPKAL